MFIAVVKHFYEELGTDRGTELNKDILEDINLEKVLNGKQIEEISRPITEEEIQSAFHIIEPKKAYARMDSMVSSHR